MNAIDQTVNDYLAIRYGPGILKDTIGYTIDRVETGEFFIRLTLVYHPSEQPT